MTTSSETNPGPGPGGADDVSAGTVPFGKYRGRPASAMLEDAEYCAWLLAQDWLERSYPQVHAWLADRAGGHGPVVPRVAARYEYRDAAGTLRYVVVRFDPKGFEIVAADGSALPNPVPRDLAVLYRLPELGASPPGSTVFVCEGEKDADAVAGLGLVAVTNPCGTRMGWQRSYTPHLAGYHVVVLPDADGPGAKHAEAVRRALTGTALSVVVCDLHEHRRGPWDVSDWLDGRGRGGDRLLAVVAKARFTAAGVELPRGGLRRDVREELVWTSGLGSTAKLVLAAACHLTGWREGAPWPAAAAIGRAATLHRVTVQNTLTGLRRAGVLEHEAGGIAWDVLALS